jgi:hypothetical protein
VGLFVLIVLAIAAVGAVQDRRQGEPLTRTIGRIPDNAGDATETVGGVGRGVALFGLGVTGALLTVALQFAGDLIGIVEGAPLIFGWLANLGLVWGSQQGLLGGLGPDLLVIGSVGLFVFAISWRFA